MLFSKTVLTSLIASSVLAGPVSKKIEEIPVPLGAPIVAKRDINLDPQVYKLSNSLQNALSALGSLGTPGSAKGSESSGSEPSASAGQSQSAASVTGAANNSLKGAATSGLIDLGSWTTSIKSVSTSDPTVDPGDVYETLTSQLLGDFWNSDLSNFNLNCDNTDTPVVWNVAVAGKAVSDGGNRDQIKKVMNALSQYKSNDADGYSASTGKDNDIYIDDDAQVLWVFIDAYKNSIFDGLNKARSLMSYIESYKDKKNGGVLWSVNGDYIASISTLEAGLAAARLFEVTYNNDYLDFAKYCTTWTLENLLDTNDKFIYDGISGDSGTLNKGKLTYTIGVAISTLTILQKHDGSQNWKSYAVELAVRFMGGGQLNTQFFSDGHINDQIRYSHLLFVGLVDLIEDSNPSGSYEQSAYSAIKNLVVREARYLYDKHKDGAISKKCTDVTDLLDFGSLTQIFYQASRVASEI
ncbi:Six-hairpin glycosidase [Hyphopichia burtonii NRRL Y-1933]|uniref:Six-hairpin glycosidase n=1 Tax=Hyphopichia burtonii NRRL Y-1933 TaxID=984485 RepID=A0A1E4RG70_9ASCO|nr:Six-hairpin glycosidase [Hyphopichia burtonii NRRL Y-1933]ODV66253.1 Six-hairpin glycosidase [Hyphopichia burtonii NRRL Y-1933]